MATIITQRARERGPTARRGEEACSFAVYMRDRPAPLDGVERVLLRLDWLVWRRARQRRG